MNDKRLNASTLKVSLNKKVFKSIQNSINGDVNQETLFYYYQNGDIVTAEYSGGKIVLGHLIGRILASGQLDLRYHHINNKGELMVGICLSDPESLQDGRIRLREKWQWLTGDQSSGESVIEEVMKHK